MLYHGVNGYREGDAVSLWERLSRESSATKKSDIDENPHLVGAKTDGCEVAKHCLECPLPQCRLDSRAAYYWWKHADKRKAVLDALKEQRKGQRDGSLYQIAKRFRISISTLYRLRDGDMKEQAT